MWTGSFLMYKEEALLCIIWKELICSLFILVDMAKACTRNGIHALLCPSEADPFPNVHDFCDAYGHWRTGYADMIKTAQQPSSSVVSKKKKRNTKQTKRKPTTVKRNDKPLHRLIQSTSTSVNVRQSTGGRVQINE